MKQISKRNTTIFSFKKIIIVVLSALFFLSSLPTLASIPSNNAYENYDLINVRTKELNLNLLANIQIILDQRKLNLCKYIPLQNLPTTDDGRVISRRILRQTLQTISDDADFINTPLIDSANSLNAIVTPHFVGQSQSISFRVRTLETVAEVIYKGVVQAKLAYDIGDHAATLEVSKNISGRTIAYTHRNNEDGASNQIGVRWSF